jgi:hypothetical protein
MAVRSNDGSSVTRRHSGRVSLVVVGLDETFSRFTNVASNSHGIRSHLDIVLLYIANDLAVPANCDSVFLPCGLHGFCDVLGSKLFFVE